MMAIAVIYREIARLPTTDGATSGTSHGGGGPASIAGNAGKIERATKGKEIRRPNFPLTGQSVGSTDRSSDAGLGMGGFAGRNETSGYCPLA
jgi:hypothetical protein